MYLAFGNRRGSRVLCGRLRGCQFFDSPVTPNPSCSSGLLQLPVNLIERSIAGVNGVAE